MRHEKITKDIIHLHFPSRKILARTFLRFQEYYENPIFKGKIFSLDEYKSWEISQLGEFSYYKKWGGFNIPSYILKPFYKGKFNPLSNEEIQLLNLFKNKMGKYYMIGTSGKKNKTTLKHEIAHGLFYTSPRYRKNVLKILKKVKNKTRREFAKYLKIGYDKSTWIDEIHAYILTNSAKSLRKKGINPESLKEIKKLLNKNYYNFYPY